MGLKPLPRNASKSQTDEFGQKYKTYEAKELELALNVFFSGILSAICANTGKYFYKSNIKYLSTNVHYYFKMQNYD